MGGLTQIDIIRKHLLDSGSINTDEARVKYGIVDVPKVLSKLSKQLNIKHISINNRSPSTGKIRPIMKYVLERR